MKSDAVRIGRELVLDKASDDETLDAMGLPNPMGGRLPIGRGVISWWIRPGSGVRLAW